jgi:hypothetical protein
MSCWITGTCRLNIKPQYEMPGKFLFETDFLETVAFLCLEVNPVTFYIFKSTRLEKTCTQHMFKRSFCSVLLPLEVSETYILYLPVFFQNGVCRYEYVWVCMHAHVSCRMSTGLRSEFFGDLVYVR